MHFLFECELMPPHLWLSGYSLFPSLLFFFQSSVTVQDTCPTHFPPTPPRFLPRPTDLRLFPFAFACFSFSFFTPGVRVLRVPFSRSYQGPCATTSLSRSFYRFFLSARCLLRVEADHTSFLASAFGRQPAVSPIFPLSVMFISHGQIFPDILQPDSFRSFFSPEYSK